MKTFVLGYFFDGPAHIISQLSDQPKTKHCSHLCLLICCRWQPHCNAGGTGACTSGRLIRHWWVSICGTIRHCRGGAGRLAVAGSGGGEGERLRQWGACRGIVGAAAAQRLHSGVVGAGGGGQVCCSVGEAAAGPRWRGGITEVAGVTLSCWCVGGVVIKIVLLHYLLLVSQPHPLRRCVFFFVQRLYVTDTQ